jgi:hypothetical protein
LLLVSGLATGGCELLAGIENLERTGDADGTPEGGLDVVEAAMAPPDGPSMLPETGPIEASAVPDSCVPMPENCTNGVDDDCNGLIDCADPTCMTRGYACVPEWPSGWTPVALYDTLQAGGPAPTIPSCTTGDTAYDNLLAFGYYNPVPTAATCSCSACGSPSGITCSDPTVGTGSSVGCATGAPASIGTSCTSFSPVQTGGVNGISLVATSAPSGGGTCADSTSTQTIPTWEPTSTSSWEGAGRVCGAETAPSTLQGAAAGCPSEDYCLLAPTNGLVCIYNSSQQTCPSSTLYTGQHTYSTSGTDNRTCTGSCTCTPDTTGVTCSSTVDVYNGGTCTGSVVTLTDTSPCNSGNPPNWGDPMSGQATLTPSGGSCTLSSSYALTGSIVPGGTQTTVCCIP